MFPSSIKIGVSVHVLLVFREDREIDTFNLPSLIKPEVLETYIFKVSYTFFSDILFAGLS